MPHFKSKSMAIFTDARHALVRYAGDISNLVTVNNDLILYLCLRKSVKCLPHDHSLQFKLSSRDNRDNWCYFSDPKNELIATRNGCEISKRDDACKWLPVGAVIDGRVANN